MRAGAWIAIAMLVGCGEPEPLPCTVDATCSGGVCTGGFCAFPDESCASQLRYHESAGDLAGDCVPGGGSGSGAASDQIYELRGNHDLDASNAANDVSPPCASPTGRDVMFKLRLEEQRRLYIDTFNTSYNVALAVYSGPCTAIAESAPLACIARDQSCSTTTKQWSEILNPGDYCIVVDQADDAPAGNLRVRSKLGAPAQNGIITNRMGTTLNSGTTCGPNSISACTQASGGEVMWFFMTCGQTFHADTCYSGASWPGYLAVFSLAQMPLACGIGCSDPTVPFGVQFSLPEPGPIWLVADGPTSSCGVIEVDVTVL